MLFSLVMAVQGMASLSLLAIVAILTFARRPRREDVLVPFLLLVGSYAVWTMFSTAMRLSLFPLRPIAALTGDAAMLTGWSVFFFVFRKHPLPEKGMRLSRWALWATLALLPLPWHPDFAIPGGIDNGQPIIQRGWPFFVVGGWASTLTGVGLVALGLRVRREPGHVHRRRDLLALVGILVGGVSAVVFSWLLPAAGVPLQHLAWLGALGTVIVTAILLPGIARSRIYDVQNPAYRIVLLLFASSVVVALLVIALVLLSGNSVHTQPLPGLTILATLLASHALLAWVFPHLARVMTGRRTDPDDVVRQVLGLAADVERGVEEVCRDVAVLLKLALPVERIVVAIPTPRGFRISAPEGNEIDPSQEFRLLDILNRSPRLTRALSRLVFETGSEAETAVARTQRKHPRIERSGLAMKADLRALDFEEFVPVVTAGRPLAIFLLGPKLDGVPYFPSEQSALVTIAVALSVALKNADEYGRIASVNTALLEEKAVDTAPIHRVVSVGTDREIVYRGRTMEQTLHDVERAAEHDESVLVLGETGSGKDLAVHLIHARSARKDHPLIAVNCAALADSLLENELFGHERGAYTGADRTTPGLFEQANGGVLFLDEIGEISETLQLRLLRVLEDRKVRRLGGKTVGVNIRIIAATNRDLRESVDRGLFRADLYYRLNVIPIRLPPLRDRREDIPVLLDHFLQRYAARFNREKPRITADALRLLQQYDWPGNIRELENATLRAFVNARGELTAADFPEAVIRSQPARNQPARAGTVSHLERRNGESLDDFSRRMEAILIQEALSRHNGNKARAAKDLGLSRTTFYNKLAQLQAAASRGPTVRASGERPRVT